MQQKGSREAGTAIPQSLLHLVSQADIAIWRFIGHQTCAIGGITGMQASVLLLLAHQGNTTSNDLARAYKLNSGAITRLVDHLVAPGLVRRVPCEYDRRVAYIQATPEGLDIARQISPIFSRSYEALLHGIARRDVDALSRSLIRIILNARIGASEH